jgi:hypothetical protein
MKNSYRFQSETLKGTDHLGDLSGRILLKLILKEYSMKMRAQFTWLASEHFLTS